MSFLDDSAMARLRALLTAPDEGELSGGRFELRERIGAPRLREGELVAGKYRVEGTIGEGGMGVIVAARHVELGRPVALKVLRARRGDDDEARLLREARALSRLESEHVARIMDVGRLDDGTPYLVIERLVGSDLARLLRERGPRSPAEAADHVLQACEALAEAHALGIVHRDLKPSNLFLTRRRDGSPCVKVLDFGISKVPSDGSVSAGSSAGGSRGRRDERSLTSPSAVIGSAWYMSPEQLESSKRVDARTDIWALGVVLHELVAGSPPFDAETAAGVGARIAAGEPARLRAVRPDAPDALEAVILRCLAKDPGQRYRDVAELARALAPFAEGSRPSVERIARVLQAGVATPAPVPAPEMALAPDAAPARATTSSAWGAHGPSAPRATIAATAAVVVAIAAGVIALRWPTPTPSSPAPAAATAVPTSPASAASIAPPAEPVSASARLPDPAPPGAAPPVSPSRPAGPRPRSGPRAPSAAPPASPAPRTVPPPTVDVRDHALDGR